MDVAQAWARLLPQAPWYVHEGEPFQRLRIRHSGWDSSPGQWPAVREEELILTYAGGSTETYQLISAYRPVDAQLPSCTLAVVELSDLGEVALSDAMADPLAFAAYLDQLEESEAIHPIVERDTITVLDVAPATPSLRIGPNAVFTLFRRPVPEGTPMPRLPVSDDPDANPRVLTESFSADNRLMSVIVESTGITRTSVPVGSESP